MSFSVFSSLPALVPFSTTRSQPRRLRAPTMPLHRLFPASAPAHLLLSPPRPRRAVSSPPPPQSPLSQCRAPPHRRRAACALPVGLSCSTLLPAQCLAREVLERRLSCHQTPDTPPGWSSYARCSPAPGSAARPLAAGAPAPTAHSRHAAGRKADGAELGPSRPFVLENQTEPTSWQHIRFWFNPTPDDSSTKHRSIWIEPIPTHSNP